MNILLVDDNPQLLYVQRELLGRLGHQVTLATDGREALRWAELEKFDVVISDIVMPNQEGLETIKLLRRMHPGLRIVAMSGGGSTDSGLYLDMALKMGADYTLSKPFSEKELMAALIGGPEPPA